MYIFKCANSGKGEATACFSPSPASLCGRTGSCPRRLPLAPGAAPPRGAGPARAPPANAAPRSPAPPGSAQWRRPRAAAAPRGAGPGRPAASPPRSALSASAGGGTVAPRSARAAGGRYVRDLTGAGGRPRSRQRAQAGRAACPGPPGRPPRGGGCASPRSRWRLGKGQRVCGQRYRSGGLRTPRNRSRGNWKPRQVVWLGGAGAAAFPSVRSLQLFLLCGSARGVVPRCSPSGAEVSSPSSSPSPWPGLLAPLPAGTTGTMFQPGPPWSLHPPSWMFTMTAGCDRHPSNPPAISSQMSALLC